MSRNTTAPSKKRTPRAAKRAATSPPKKLDRRVHRTRETLGDALVALVQEKPFNQITVKELLDRADVGRSTFYAHYRDKDDLFTSDVDEFLQWMSTTLLRSGESSRRIAPVREFFAHVAESRGLYDALVASGHIHEFLDLARSHFARAIDQRLTTLRPPTASPPSEQVAISQFLAGALLTLLTWWINRNPRESPQQMDDLFHRIAWHGAVLTPSP